MQTHASQLSLCLLCVRALSSIISVLDSASSATGCGEYTEVGEAPSESTTVDASSSDTSQFGLVRQLQQLRSTFSSRLWICISLELSGFLLQDNSPLPSASRLLPRAMRSSSPLLRSTHSID